MNALLENALYWLVQGFAVIPIQWHGKRPDARLLPDGSWEGYQKKLPTELEIKRWFPGELHNLGLVMGWNNLVVIDFDMQAAYECWRQVCNIKTFEVKTQRGMHVYFRIAEPVSNMHSELLDIKAHGYVLVPPSIHPSGYQYKIQTRAAIMQIEKLSDVLPEALTPAAPVPTEFIPVQQPAITVTTGNIWDQLDNPLDPDVDMIKQIRERISLLDLVPGATRTSQGGRWYTALCPFHDDHHPSFWIDLSRGLCGCRACGMKPMDVINFTARKYGLSNYDAIFQLSKGI